MAARSYSSVRNGSMVNTAQALKALTTVDANQRRQVLARLSTRTLRAAAGLAASKTLQCSAPGKAAAGAWGISWQRTLTLKASYGRR